jgi:hypothetical protein
VARPSRALLASTTALAGALTLTLGLAGPASAGGVTVLHTKMTGAAQAPAAGDPDGRGNAVLRVDAATGEICYDVSTTRVDPLMAGHIHRKAAGASTGPVVQGFTQVSDRAFRGCVVNPTVAAGLLSDPAEYYVNVHDEAYPNGAVRGDLG